MTLFKDLAFEKPQIRNNGALVMKPRAWTPGVW